MIILGDNKSGKHTVFNYLTKEWTLENKRPCSDEINNRERSPVKSNIKTPRGRNNIEVSNSPGRNSPATQSPEKSVRGKSIYFLHFLNNNNTLSFFSLFVDFIF